VRGPQVPYFRHSSIEPAFLSKAALALQPTIVVPSEVVSCESLTIVFSGLVAKDGHCGIRVFGDDMVLNNITLRHLNPAMALTIAQLQQMSRTTLEGLLNDGDFPVARRCVRQAAIKLTLKRVILKTASWAREHCLSEGAVAIHCTMSNGARSDLPHHTSRRAGADDCQLGDCFERCRRQLGLATDEPLYSVRKTPLENRLEEVDASVSHLGTAVHTRVDNLRSEMSLGLARLAGAVEALGYKLDEQTRGRRRGAHRKSTDAQEPPPQSEPTKSPPGRQRRNPSGTHLRRAQNDQMTAPNTRTADGNRTNGTDCTVGVAAAEAWASGGSVATLEAHCSKEAYSLDC
jgi:hypothetical protein